MLANVSRNLIIGSTFVVQVLMAAVTVIVLLGVFFRYVMHDALVWSEEAARYLMIWMGFLACGIALREGGHIAITLLMKRAPTRLRVGLAFVVRALCLIFLASVVVLGTMLVLRVKSQSSPALGISMLWPYLAIPAGCLLMAIELVAAMVRDPAGAELDDHAIITEGTEP